jgi:hypothetical protein
MLRRGREIYREYLRERLLSPVRCGLGLLRSNPHDVHPLAWEYKFRLRRLGSRLRWRAVADPFKTVRVSPDEIDRYTDAFGKWESVGLISAGDWDRRAEPIEEFPKYRGCVDRFVHGLPWEETDVIPYVLDRIEEEGRWDGCTTPEEVYDRYEAMDELYHSIRENGFVSPVDVRPERHEDKRFFDYVAVHVGRDGELIFGLSGCHRLSIAKLLDDVEEIPVWIRGRHAGWQRTREAVAGRDSVEGPLRSHPDLQDLIGR